MVDIATEAKQPNSYQWLAEHEATPLLNNPSDTLSIEYSPANTTVPAVYPLVSATENTLSQSTWQQTLASTPLGKHLQKWGIISAGVGVGTLAMGGILGSSQQQWHPQKVLTSAEQANPKQPYIVEMLTEQPSWWEGRQATQAHRYTAKVVLPNNPWAILETNQLYVTLQPQQELTIADALSVPKLTIKPAAIGKDANNMQHFLAVTTYHPPVVNADTGISGGSKDQVLNIVWDTTTKTMKSVNNESLQTLSPAVEKALTQCLEWFHSPESLKQGLKPKNNIHLTGLQEVIPLTVLFTSITGIVGACAWFFKKHPKPLIAAENSLNNLPAA
jgi:hypothetical protein